MSDGITTFRIKYPNQASFWFQAWHHGHASRHCKCKTKISQLCFALYNLQTNRIWEDLRHHDSMVLDRQHAM